MQVHNLSLPFEPVRAFAPAEQMVDALDRASTSNFTILARIDGPLSEPALTRALRALELRHPLLRARIERAQGKLRFVMGEGAPIPMRVVEGLESDWQELAAATLEHRAWPDNGPRVELTWLRHGEHRSTLLFCYQHVVSDGISAMIVLRDLLSLVTEPQTNIEPLASPGQLAFYPTRYRGLRLLWRAARWAIKLLLMPRPRRLRAVRETPLANRRVQLHGLRIAGDLMQALRARAERDGVSVHGLLCAALAQATSAELGTSARQRILHPVDLRRYFQQTGSDRPEIGDAVGYYTSGVYTNHYVDVSAPLLDLAREIHESVRERKADEEPLFAASHLGPLLTKLTSGLPREHFRRLAESQIFIGTFQLSNLGRLDVPGLLHSEFAELALKDVWGVSAGSVLHAMTVVVTSFRGITNIQLSTVQPFISREAASRMMTDMERRLRQYAAPALSESSAASDLQPSLSC